MTANVRGSKGDRPTSTLRIAAKGIADDFPHRPLVADGDGRIHVSDRRSDRGQKRTRVAAGPGYEEEWADARVFDTDQNLRPAVAL